MAIKAIIKYLDQKVHNYDEGRLLFERYSDNKVLSVLFRTGSSTYHHRRLLGALTDLSILEEPSGCPVRLIDKAALKSVIPPLSDFDVPGKVRKVDQYMSFPEQIQQVVRTKNLYYKRAQQLFIEIGFTEDRDKRLEMALTLLDDHEQVNACWATIDEYKETGTILIEKAKTIQDEIDVIGDVQLGQSLNNIRANISKDKKKLKSLPDGHKRAKVLLRYQANLLKLDLIQKRIGGADE